MKFLEKDLETIIWETSNELLEERDFYIRGKKNRQLKIGNYGVADLVTFEKQYYYSQKTNPFLNITVYELKKEKIGISAFLQAIRYCKGIKSYLEDNKPNIKFVLNIVLCAKDIDLSGDFVYLTDLLYSENNFGQINSIDYYTFTYDFNGINFKQHSGYNLINKGF